MMIIIRIRIAVASSTKNTLTPDTLLDKLEYYGNIIGTTYGENFWKRLEYLNI